MQQYPVDILKLQLKTEIEALMLIEIKEMSWTIIKVQISTNLFY